MKSAAALFLLALSSIAVSPARAADEPTLESMVTCRQSWLDWKDDPTPGKKFVESLHTNYKAQQDGGYLVPKTKTTLFGLPVARVYPDSVGMGLGFSVSVSASFDAAKKATENATAKPLKCEPDSDGMHSCELELGPKKVVTVASDIDDNKHALIGCFYYYEK